MPQFWRVHCHIGHHPGQWQFWFREQCCAVGWAPPEWTLNDGLSEHRGWVVARNALKRMRPGDWIVATLPDSRVGRLGRIVELAVNDEEWNPIVPRSRTLPNGENGRRILVRWELDTGPDDPSKVVLLPATARLNRGEVLGTVRSLPLERLEPIRNAMRDEVNWVSLAGRFSMETALSDYLSVHPQRLESGMIACPSVEVREFTFPDRKRADVILQDRKGRVAIVECKQNGPTEADINQVVGYRTKIEQQFPEFGASRTLLVHGGSRRVLPEVSAYAKRCTVELIYFELSVSFSDSR